MADGVEAPWELNDGSDARPDAEGAIPQAFWDEGAAPQEPLMPSLEADAPDEACGVELEPPMPFGLDNDQMEQPEEPPLPFGTDEGAQVAPQDVLAAEPSPAPDRRISIPEDVPAAQPSPAPDRRVSIPEDVPAAQPSPAPDRRVSIPEEAPRMSKTSAPVEETQKAEPRTSQKSAKPEERAEAGPSQETSAVHIEVDDGPAPEEKRSGEKEKRNSMASLRGEVELYEMLGVEPTAPDTEIRNAYKKRALQLHPDKGGDPEKFKSMKEAYEVLINPQKRAVYDLHGMEGIRHMEQAAQMEANMSDIRPVLLMMMQLAETGCAPRLLLVSFILFIGLITVLPFILIVLKWDGSTSFSWVAAAIPWWILQLTSLCVQLLVLRAPRPAGDPQEWSEETLAAYRRSRRELMRFRMQSCVSNSFLLAFQVLLLLRLEETTTVSWFVVMSPWFALEVWWLLLRVSYSQVAWTMEDPRAATAAAADGQVTKAVAYWIFLFGFLQMGVSRLLTAVFIASRADVEEGVTWWVVFIPLYIAYLTSAALTCCVRRREKGLLEEDEETGSARPACCMAAIALAMLFLTAGKLDGGLYSAAWIFSPIFFFVSLATLALSLTILFARPRHFEQAAQAMGEPIGKPAETE